jgi:erythronate-4-phosphate dehydrogenase
MAMEQIVREAVFHTYNIENDSEKLRQCPSDFEKQRGDYPLRREFASYTVDLKRATEEVKQILKNIGFRVTG